jgi:hypothetical protein
MATCGRTGFDHYGPRTDIQPGSNKRNVGKIQYLCPVRKGARPKLRSRPQDMNEATPIARRNLAPVWNTDDILMSIIAKAAVELLPSLDNKG